jgi:acyl-CoA thioester hydrolase
MSFVHHSNYVKYYENARWEALKAIGINYSDVEKRGYFMPVISMNFEFIKPAYFDDILTIHTIINDIPRARIRFDYEMFNQENELINKAHTVLAFIDKENKKACLPPVFFQKQLFDVL